ncbi:MAG: DUF4432 family protein [Chloroflexota bacterium]|nr:DUF4432 family protein [Chloroflexota bacterium]
MAETRLHLIPAQFTDRERPLASFHSLSATAFRYDSGVSALRLESAYGGLVILPFQGQQVWSAEFGGPGVGRRVLTMRSMFDEPHPTEAFLETFGGFLQHCGVMGVGAPSAEDTHPLHGELPNAPYQKAYLVTGEDERGTYMGVGGSYRHTVAFAHDYTAEPLVKLYADFSIFNVSMTITNRKRSDMELLYLAHVNFRPVDNGRLLYSARSTPEHVRVRTTIPSHILPGPGYADFIARLQQDPSLHETLAPDLPFDPEVVFFIDYLADAQGWAHSMQRHPDGTADYIRHRLDQLPKGTRWISRTPDQDAIALVEAGTTEPEGYLAEKAKGNVKILGPGEAFHASLDIGVLSPEEAQRVEEQIQEIVAGASERYGRMKSEG